MTPNVDTSPTGGIGWRNLRTGILFLAGILLVGSLGLIIGKNSSLLTRHDTTYLFLTDIRGLSEGNMVAISGKKIGTVQSMDFAERNDTAGVIIALDIVHDYIHLITKDSRAVIKALGVLGDKYIDIAVGHSEELLQGGEFLPVSAEPGLEELTASALKTMNTIQNVSAKIDNGQGTIGKLITSSELNDRLLATVVNVESLTTELTHGNGLVSRLLYDRQMAQHASSLLADLSEVSGSLKAGKGTIGKLIVDESFYATLELAMRRTDSLVARMNDPASSIGRFTRDDAFYMHLDHSIISLDSLLIDFQQNPGRYVKVSVF
jgi:phospholipid/cholesterol/gamma-HCH transport system substrate-binding protein